MAGRRRRLLGKAAVKQYWLQQWPKTRTHDEPLRFRDMSPRRVVVHVSQTVQDRHGLLLSHGSFEHSFGITGGLINRMDISDCRHRPPAQPTPPAPRG